MKNLKISLLVFLAFSISFKINAQHIQLGNSPETTNRTPINYVWPYSYTQTIYTAEEILFAGANPNGGQIQKIRYKPTESVNTQYWRNWEIYMGNTQKQSFNSSTDWLAIDNFQLVFDGYLTSFTVSTEWLEIELDAEFTWNPNSNLVIAVREKSLGFGNAPNWAAYNNEPETGHKAIYGYQMDYIYNIENPPPANGLTNIVAQIQLVGENFLAPCMPPVNAQVQAVTTNTVSLNWEPPFYPPTNGFDIYYSTNPALADDNTVPNYTTTPGFNNTTITGLIDNETYYIWLRSNCDIEGVSNWRGPIIVTTPCYPYTIPYEEDFEFGYQHDQDIANCIVQESMSGNNYWKANKTYTSYNRSPRVGDWNACLQRSNSKWMFIPVELEANQEYLISFWARQDLNEGAKISVKYGLINSSEAMTNTILENVEIYSGDYQEIAESFTVPNSGMYFVGIFAEVFADPWYLSIDDIIIDYLPTCWKPDNLQLEQVFTSGAKISWTDNANQTNNGYEIYVTTSNQKPLATATPIGNVAANTYEYHITNLNSNTTYYAWVRTNCSANDKSRWAGPIKFTTEYLAETAYLQEFNEGDVLLPYNLNSWIVGAARGATGNPANCIYVNLNENLQSDWFTTSYVAPITNGMVLRFEYKATNYNYPYSPTAANAGNLVVEITNELDNNFTQLISIDNNNEAEYNIVNVDLSDYVNQVIKFKFTANRFSDNYDLSIDNIFIGDSIICEKPTELSAINITPNSARLTWEHYAENFDIEWGLSGFQQGSGNIETSNTNYLDINELNENTEYEFYVRAWCYDIFEGEWAGPYSFTSDCYPYSIPYFEGFENGYVHDQNIAACLSQESLVGNSSFLANNVYSNYNRTPRTGVWNAVLTYANTQY
ncbi:MAG: hypothetical protein GX879_04065, partial [Bacteroidales bacterium]|nr:hypothetical protein [Bacteroidales bacterium]